MAITTLDPKTALIVIDLQKGIVGLPDIIRSRRDHGARAGARRRVPRRELPVVLVNVEGGPPGRAEQPRRADFPPRVGPTSSPNWTGSRTTSS